MNLTRTEEEVDKKELFYRKLSLSSKCNNGMSETERRDKFRDHCESQYLDLQQRPDEAACF